MTFPYISVIVSSSSNLPVPPFLPSFLSQTVPLVSHTITLPCSLSRFPSLSLPPLFLIPILTFAPTFLLFSIHPSKTLLNIHL